MSRPDYGYDAPYALLTFVGAATATSIGAGFFQWRGMSRAALTLGAYFLFFAANAGSFLYTTRRGRFIEWATILDTV